MGKIKTLFLATRPQFLPAIAVPVALGASVAWHYEGVFDPLFFALSLFAALAFHAGMNVLNDYYDFKNGSDGLNANPLTPFAGGSRAIQKGLLTPRETFLLGAGLVASGALSGLYLAWASTPLLLVIGATGLFSGYSYSAPPLFLAGRGLGELTVGVNFGLLTVVGSSMAQTKSFLPEAALASLPLSFLIAGLLFINQFPDYESDRLAGKRNLVVRLGPTHAKAGLLVLVLSAYVGLTALPLGNVLPKLSLIALIGMVPALSAALGLMRNYKDKLSLVPAIKSIILAHLSTGLLQTIAFILA